MRSHISLNQTFYGPNQEFGLAGKITQDNFPQFFRDERKKKVDMKTLMF
jgi:hypothetical protein